MSEFLASARLKVKWAKQNLTNLERAIDERLAKASPYEIAIEDDPQTGQRIYRAVALNPLPEEWPCMIGDIAQNLRTALDHLACGLVRCHSGPTAPIDKIAFPN